jgi:hypothetical protein
MNSQALHYSVLGAFSGDGVIWLRRGAAAPQGLGRHVPENLKARHAVSRDLPGHSLVRSSWSVRPHEALDLLNQLRMRRICPTRARWRGTMPRSPHGAKRQPVKRRQLTPRAPWGMFRTPREKPPTLPSASAKTSTNFGRSKRLTGRAVRVRFVPSNDADLTPLNFGVASTGQRGPLSCAKEIV